eukprot:c18334_g1_i1.p1 GENE.c18334_g1_i1~~c18334_g1_i1.p1  ORF type:complete len:949 (+),score=215.50 c18334_g1_i1:107-2848(+)
METDDSLHPLTQPTRATTSSANNASPYPQHSRQQHSASSSRTKDATLFTSEMTSSLRMSPLDDSELSGKRTTPTTNGTSSSNNNSTNKKQRGTVGLFVYGSLLTKDVAFALLERYPKAIGACVVGYHAGRIAERGYPGMIPKEGSTTYGLYLPQISRLELAILDDFEEIPPEQIPERTVSSSNGSSQTDAMRKSKLFSNETRPQYSRIEVQVNMSPAASKHFRVVKGVLPVHEFESGEVTAWTYVWQGDASKVLDSKWDLTGFLNSGDDFRRFVIVASNCRRDYYASDAFAALTRELAEYSDDFCETEDFVNVDQPVCVTQPIILPQGFTVYRICTQFGSVLRRFSDFESLRSSLSQIGVVPPLPEKRILGRLSYDFIEQRRAGLEAWLNAIITNDDFVSSEPVYLFLRDISGTIGKGTIRSRIVSGDDESESTDAMTTYCNLEVRCDMNGFQRVSAVQLTDKSISVFRGPNVQHASFPIRTSNLIGAISMECIVSVYASQGSVASPLVRSLRTFDFLCHSAAQAQDLAHRFVLLSRGASTHSPNPRLAIARSNPRILAVLECDTEVINWYRGHVVGLLLVHHAEVDEAIFQTRKELREWLRHSELDLTVYKTILLIGGQTVMFDFHQALFNRADLLTNNLVTIPVASIPTVTVSGTSVTAGAFDGAAAVFNALRGKVVPLDGMLIEHSPPEIVTSRTSPLCLLASLAFTWGKLIKFDAHVASWMAESKSAFGVLKSLARPAPMRARLHYLLAPTDRLPSPAQGLTFTKFETDDVGECVFDPEKGWHSIEGEFLMVTVSNLPFLTLDTLISPGSLPYDGVLDLMYIVDESPSRANLAELMMRLADGTHLENCSFVQHQRVSAVSLQPLQDTDAPMLVDGQRVPSGPIKIECFPHLFNLRCSPFVKSQVKTAAE